MTITEEVGTAKAEKLHRPYSRIRNKPERSVTEIIGTKSIPALPFAAANETAFAAVHHQDRWLDLEEDAAYEWLRKHHRGVWDARAALGSATHAVLESWFDGTTVDLFELVCSMAQSERNARSWREQEAKVTERLIGYVDGLEKWWTDWSPEGGTSEDCVRTPGLYVGQRDRWYVKMHGQTWGLDLKTTAQEDSEKGIYTDSWTLQLAAYRFAAECVDYALDETGKVIELGTRPNEPVDRTGIIHLRGDGEYTFFEVAADEKAHEKFKALAELNTWLRKLPQAKAVRP